MDGALSDYTLPHGRVKRSHDTMLSSHRMHNPNSLFIPADDEHYENEQAAHRQRLTLPRPNGLRLPGMASSTRFEGDGYDMRRPVFSSAGGRSEDVIDLTEDDGIQQIPGRSHGPSHAGTSSSRAQRPPRFGGRNILDDEPTETSSRDQRGTHGPSPSRPQVSSLRRPARFPPRQPTPEDSMDDDIEILSERNVGSRPQTVSRQLSPVFGGGVRSITPFPGSRSGDNEPIDLTDDDVVVMNSRSIRPEGGINGARPGVTAGVGTRIEDDESTGYGGIGIGRLRQMLGGNVAPRLFDRIQRLHDPHHRHHGARIHVHEHVHDHGHGHVPLGLGNLPGAMDMTFAAFDLGIEGGGPPRAASPRYEPPGEPGAGFTRNPEEDEVVVCPNCGDELAVGGDEVKQQVWVIKGCGHAYCGECTQHRKRTSKGKAKAVDPILPQPFNACVVQDCDKKVTGKGAMFRVYFGS